MPKDEWKITDHVCRICFGRVLARGTQARCADCGTEVEGGHRHLCWCGAKLRDGKDARLRCKRNTEITPELPMEVIVVCIDKPVAPVRKRTRPARVSGGGWFDV